MTDIDADIGRPAQTHQGIHIGPVHVHLAPLLVDDGADLPDLLLENPWVDDR